MRTSTGKPTKEEAARIVAAKEGPCIACYVWRGGVPGFIGCDYHHCKSGNIRRGHLFGFGLCKWHHVGHAELCSAKEMRVAFGPSLMDGGKLFREAYGSDDSLIELQSEIIKDKL